MTSRAALLWDDEALVTLTWDGADHDVVPRPPSLVRPPRAIRQVGPRLIALISSDDSFAPGPEPEGTLVLLPVDEPETPIVLGTANRWFPSYDGDGVWGVRALGPRSEWNYRDMTFEATEFGLDGAPRAAVRLDEIEPVAATRRGLAALRTIPSRRPYPPGIGGGAQTLIGGHVVDVVGVDAVTGEVTSEIARWARVGLAGVHGQARIHNSDPNVKVRATEVIDLDTGETLPDPPVELACSAYPHHGSVQRGGTVMMDAANPRQLTVMTVAGRREVISHRIGKDPPGRRRLAQVWSDDELLFVEQDERGATLARWSPESGRLPSAAAVLSRSAIPLASWQP